MTGLAEWYETLRAQGDSPAHPGADSLIDYARHTIRGYMTPRHIVELGARLEAVERGDLTRLMVVMPPRHGKSLLVSQRLPAWWMARNPTDEIIHASYGGELVSGFGRRVRNLMTQAQHQDVFPGSSLSPDSKAANLWHTSEDGVYVAAGVGGPITGRGADLLLIDDPVKNREEADSERMRERVWDWYVNDARTRLHPGARIVLVQTRWHDDDLAGRLLAAQDSGGEQWDVLHYPAIGDAGEALWPERYDLDTLERTRATIGARAWQALYQGDPAPDTGVYFERGWIRKGQPPERARMRLFGASDYATTFERGDHTVHCVFGLDDHKRLWLLDMWRGQTDTAEWVAQLLRLMANWRPEVWLEEAGQILKSVGPFIARRQREQNVNVRRLQLTSAVDKPTRARSIQGWASVNGIYIDSTLPLAGTVEGELLRFPTGTRDDIVDCWSLMGRILATAREGEPPPPPPEEWKPPGPPTWDEVLDRNGERRPGQKRRKWRW